MMAMDFRAAGRAFHWLLLSQEADLPERLLGADPDAFINHGLSGMTGGRNFIEPQALEAYRTAFRNSAVRRAMCEDYRTAMNEDLALDTADREQGRKITCPMLVIWPDRQQGTALPEAMGIWRKWADQVVGLPTSGGHLQLEDSPLEVLEALLPFLDTHPASQTPLQH